MHTLASLGRSGLLAKNPRMVCWPQVSRGPTRSGKRTLVKAVLRSLLRISMSSLPVAPANDKATITDRRLNLIPRSAYARIKSASWSVSGRIGLSAGWLAMRAPREYSPVGHPPVVFCYLENRDSCPLAVAGGGKRRAPGSTGSV